MSVKLSHQEVWLRALEATIASLCVTFNGGTYVPTPIQISSSMTRADEVLAGFKARFDNDDSEIVTP